MNSFNEFKDIKHDTSWDKTIENIDPGENVWHAFKVPFFWGIGLVFHGIKAFDSVPFIGKDWEERKIKEMMDKKK